MSFQCYCTTTEPEAEDPEDTKIDVALGVRDGKKKAPWATYFVVQRVIQDQK